MTLENLENEATFPEYEDTYEYLQMIEHPLDQGEAAAMQWTLLADPKVVAEIVQERGRDERVAMVEEYDDGRLTYRPFADLQALLDAAADGVES